MGNGASSPEISPSSGASPRYCPSPAQTCASCVPLLCTSPGGTNNRAPTSPGHLTLASDPHPPDTVLLVSCKATGTGQAAMSYRPGPSTSRQLPKPAGPPLALQCCSHCPPRLCGQGGHQADVLLRTASRHHAGAGILPDMDPGGLSLGHGQKRPLLPASSGLPAASCPSRASSPGPAQTPPLGSRLPRPAWPRASAQAPGQAPGREKRARAHTPCCSLS